MSSRTERVIATASSVSGDATGQTCFDNSRRCQAELGIVLLPVEAKREVAAGAEGVVHAHRAVEQEHDIGALADARDALAETVEA